MQAQSSTSHCSPLLWHLRVAKITTCFEWVEVLKLMHNLWQIFKFLQEERNHKFLPKNFEPTNNKQPTNHQPPTNHHHQSTTEKHPDPHLCPYNLHHHHAAHKLHSHPCWRRLVPQLYRCLSRWSPPPVPPNLRGRGPQPQIPGTCRVLKKIKGIIKRVKGLGVKKAWFFLGWRSYNDFLDFYFA